MDKILTHEDNAKWLGQYQKEVYLDCIKLDKIKLNFVPDLALFGKNNFMAFESFINRKTSVYYKDN